jgi:ketosteroid isomerase-like protein
MKLDPIAVARTSYQAYVHKDRAAIEGLIADDFHFTSPLDNRIDRATYFEGCWPNSTTIAEFNLLHTAPDSDCVFVTYEARSTSGKRFRNCEVLTAHEGKIIDVEVYFGWEIPHEVVEGGFVGNQI